LPVEVKAWIEKWLGYKGEAVALVALFDCPPEQVEHALTNQAYLAGVAKEGHLEFFIWPEVVPGKEGRPESLIPYHHSDMTEGALRLPA
jgi:hypothetical protein